jgi:hypothetical protein
MVCSVPITTLVAAPFDFNWLDSIYAKVKATNFVGNSSESTEGNEAIILTYPDAPVFLENSAATTSATVVAMSWSEGSENGGTPVIDYKVS